jgi:hypothetical protein
LILGQKSTEDGQEQHEELPEIMGPFLAAPMAIRGMSVVVDFHN